MRERRSGPRIRQRRRVGVVLSSGEVVSTWTHDISQGGLQILSEYSADVGDRFTLIMSLFDPERDAYAEMRAEARIIHVVYSGEMGCYRIGMQFLRFEGDGEDVLERFIEYRLRVMYQGVG